MPSYPVYRLDVLYIPDGHIYTGHEPKSLGTGGGGGPLIGQYAMWISTYIFTSFIACYGRLYFRWSFDAVYVKLQQKLRDAIV